MQHEDDAEKRLDLFLNAPEPAPIDDIDEGDEAPAVDMTAPRITISTGRADKKRAVTLNLADFASKLSEHRVKTLIFIRDNPGLSVREVADGLGRPYRRVHDDVDALLDLGLIRIDLPDAHEFREKLRRGISSALRVVPGSILATIDL